MGRGREAGRERGGGGGWDREKDFCNTRETRHQDAVSTISALNSTLLQHNTATHNCNTLLQHIPATHYCNTLHTSSQDAHDIYSQQHTTATHDCNTPLQHTPATHYGNTLHTTATHYTRLQHTTATHDCNTRLQHTTATHDCNTRRQHTTATHYTPAAKTRQARHSFSRDTAEPAKRRDFVTVAALSVSDSSPFSISEFVRSKARKNTINSSSSPVMLQ